MEIAIILIFIGLFISGLIIFTVILGLVYWGLSIGMAPILWLMFGIGLLIGLFKAIRNAFKAFGMVRTGKRGSNR